MHRLRPRWPCLSRWLGLGGSALLAVAGPALAQTFSDQTAASGLNFTTSVAPDIVIGEHYPGGAVGDFNRDGWPDLFLIGGGGAGVPDALFINQGDGTFVNQAASWGVALVHRGRGAAVGDYDRNGWPDIYVTSGGDLSSIDRPGQHILYRNNGNGTFTNVATAAGVNWTSVKKLTTSATWGDYDLDGDLDLMVMTWDIPNDGNRLFRNNGNGTFTDVTVAAGVTSNVHGFASRFVDMNGDRWPELLLVADFGTSKVLKNNGNGTFTNVTPGSGTALESNGMGTCVGDFNRDGLQDWHVTSAYRDNPSLNKDGNYLYVNQGAHLYVALPHASGLQDGGWGWGSESIDFDHDGHIDVAETNGWDDAEYLNEPSYLYRNNGDMTFTRSDLPKNAEGRSLMTLDYDRDGDLDIVITCYNAPVMLWRNDVSGPGRNWLEVFLDTSAAPALAPEGLGARLTAQTGAITQHFYMSRGATYLGQSQNLAHFGLGSATDVDVLTVEWPDGTTTVWNDVPANQSITISPGTAGAPGESSDPELPADQMRASWNRVSGAIDVSYTPACGASNHTIYYGELAQVAGYGYSGAACGRGTSGTTSFVPGTLDAAFFVIVGNTGLLEGSYGRRSTGQERPQDTATPGCDLPQDLSTSCN
jgi:hypothetical protein